MPRQGDGGDDWLEGGPGQDLLTGDHGSPFFDDPGQVTPGNEVMVGQSGDDYVAEGGDDLMAANAAPIDTFIGSAGFDWVFHQFDTVAANDDLSVAPGVQLPPGVSSDRWQETEAVSGSAKDDVIRGDDVVPRTLGGAGSSGCDVLDQAGVDRISGLGALLPHPLTGDPVPVVAASAAHYCPISGPVWGEGNILIGGAGSDTIRGGGGDDVIDGDRSLKVRISVRDDQGTEIGSTDLLEHTYQVGNPHTLQADVFAGIIDPGHLVTVREIVDSSPQDATASVDTAVFSEPEGSYTVTTVPAGAALGSPGSTTTVRHDNGGVDGTDTLRNIEKLQFATSPGPAAPTGVSAVAGDASATVTWTAPTGVGSPITGYSVRVVNGKGTQVGALHPAAADQHTLLVTGLANGTPVRFQVATVIASGTGAFSALSAPVTPDLLPGAPGIGTPTVGSGSATVRWTAPAANGGSPITQYSVQVFDAADNPVGAARPAAANATSLLVTGLVNGSSYTFAVSATNGTGEGPASARSDPFGPHLSGPGFTGLTPKRVMDTRIGTGVAKGRVGAGGQVTLTVPGLPSTATAVVLNVTAINPTTSGFLTVYPAGTTRPTTSSLNFVAGQTVPNLVMVKVGTGGKVTVYNSAGTVDIIADLAGYYSTGGAGFIGETGRRVMDTRTGTGVAQAKVAARAEVTVTIPNLPAGTKSVALNVTASSPTAAGFLTAYPTGSARPTTSSLNFVAGQTVSNLVVVNVGPGGKVTFFNSAGTVDVVADLSGSFSSNRGDGFTGQAPGRVLDTRAGIGVPRAKVAAGAEVTLFIPGLPAGTTSVVLNVTATNPTATGFLTVYPAGAVRPATTNVSYAKGRTVPNLVVVNVGPGSTVTFFNSAGTVDVIADLAGYYRP